MLGRLSSFVGGGLRPMWAGFPPFFWGRGVAPRCASSGCVVGSAGRLPADGPLRPC